MNNGISVWWDQDVPADESERQASHDAADAASCFICCFSAHEKPIQARRTEIQWAIDKHHLDDMKPFTIKVTTSSKNANFPKNSPYPPGTEARS